jgi:hypothetical protein
VRKSRGFGSWTAVIAFAVGCSRAPTSARTVEAPGPASTAVTVTAAGRFRFAPAADARAILGKRDGFVAALGPVDRSLRLASRAPVDEASYLAFTAKQAMDFTEPEEDRLRGALRRLDERMRARSLDIAEFAPPEIPLVKTTGKEEFGLPAAVSVSEE